MRWDVRWRGRLLVLGGIVIVALVGHDAIARWDAEALGPARQDADIAPLGAGELRVVTWNAWRLHAPERVPGLVRAIDRVGEQLARGAEPRPELVAIQEIESREAIAALERELGADGFFASCECAHHIDGSLRSAVAIAVRAPLRVRSHECIPLASIVPDHSRCAVLARVLDEQGRSFDFVGVHLAWHVANEPMADRLRRELAARDALGPRTIVAGDLNAWPGTDAFARMIEPPLSDARPDAPPTHFLGWRLDHVIHGEELDVVRALDRRWSHDTFEPAAAFLLPRACAHGGPPDCPLSDHLPEGVVLRWR